MDRNREARRATMAATNGLPRRRHRTSSLRDSPDEDGPVELQETARLRDRGSGKKDRDRDRERERERDRDRDRDRDRLSRSKRRRGDRLMHGSREDGGDDSSEESVNDEEEDEDEDGGGGVGVGVGGGSVRMLPPPNPTAATSASLSSSSSMLNHQRKSFQPAKNFRAAPTLKAPDEMIGVLVPRKARSASTKRSHEWISSGIGIVAEQIHGQASTSPVRPSVSAAAPTASQAPVSPSSSNASVRKKLKPNGPKLRQPKMPSKPSSSAQDEIEIEIAEVLYGMMRQPQGPSKQEIMSNDSIKLESREANNKSMNDAKSSGDAKSRVSSPISSSQYGAPQSSSRSSQPVGEAAWGVCVETVGKDDELWTWVSDSEPFSWFLAPKRKKPRLVKYDAKYEDAKPSLLTAQSNPISSTPKVPAEQPAKTEAASANLEKIAGSAAENGGIASDTAQSNAVPAQTTEAQPEPMKVENNLVSDSKSVAEKSEPRDLGVSKEEPQSPKKESPPGHRLDDKRETVTAATKSNSTISEVETQREEKFQIDLMAPPPSRSSPERDGEINFVAVDAKPMAIDTETEIQRVIKEDAKALKIGREEAANVEPEKTKATNVTTPVEEAESKKPAVVKERNIDLQLDLEKADVRDSSSNVVGVSGNKLHQQHILPPRQQQHQQHHQQQQTNNNEKTAQSGAVPLPMSMAGWPGGLPHMGYMAPLQGVVSMDGTTVTSAAIQPPPYLFTQPRLQRCATHCYIARSISYHQQIARMNPFWPTAAAAGPGSLYGAKPGNLNVLPSPDLHANIPGRGVNSVQDKGQGLAMFPGQSGKDKASQAANVVDGAQRKQILLQQALPPGAPSNILQAPAIIFPLSQQQAVTAASVRPGSVKSPSAAGNATSSNVPNSTSATASATAAAAAPAITFSYPNMPGNEAPPYLAINAYPFPIPAHVGAPPAYRGTHPQGMSFFNGSFYSTFHPQLQQQQPPSHLQQNQQGHQNPSMSSSSSSSQKHLQNQQQRPPHGGTNVNGGGGNSQGFPTSKNQSSQPLQLHQRQQQGQHLSHPARQLESEMGSEDSPSTADSRVSRPSMSIYGQNFAMPIHAPNFALMTPASIGTAGGANGASGSNGEKKQQQQQGSKSGGVEPSQAFAMSFAPINGATSAPGLDISSIAQQQAIFPDVRQGYYMAAAAAAAQAAVQQKKNCRVSEDGKTGGDSTNLEEERKAMKGSSGVGRSIAFSRPDLSDLSGSTMPGATVVDSSARTLNLSSSQQRPSSSVMPAAISNVNASNAQQQLQRNQQQQMIQLQKQQQQLAAAARTKTPPTSNGNVYSDHLTSSMAAKFLNALSTFPQNLVHSSSSPAQSPQWKNSTRSTTPQVPSPSMTSSTSSSLKNLSQQQGRAQQAHTQISFAANPKPSSQSQGLQPASSNQSPSPPIMVGSPTTSSVSKSAGGSPRTTTSTSTGNKVGQASSLSSQQAKTSPSVPNMKSSPVSGKNVPSILGNPHITASSSAGTKAQLPQQQQQLSKQSLQQAQLFFSYIPTQNPHSNSPTVTTAAASSAYSQRRRPEQQQQSQSTSGASSNGMLSLCPSVTLSNTSTSDPARAAAAAAVAAAAASNMKGLPSQALMHPAQFAAAAAAQSGNPHQLFPTGFSYVHAVPTAVQVKPAEQKQPAGE